MTVPYVRIRETRPRNPEASGVALRPLPGGFVDGIAGTLMVVVGRHRTAKLDRWLDIRINTSVRTDQRSTSVSPSSGDRSPASAALDTDPPAAAPTTLSGHPLRSVYAMSSTPAAPPPGEYPYTRGIYPEMYRARLWTMRMFAGFGAPEDTNARFKSLLAQGQTGLSTAFDMPTLMGYDPDHTLSLGEVGREGVSVAHIDDMRRLFAGIDLGAVSTSMTISGPAPVMLAFFIAAAEDAGVPRAALRGTLQTDILKEFIAQKEWIVPERPGMRLVGDLIAFCTDEMPLWHPILGLRLPHPRGRGHSRAGARLHPGRRTRIRR